MRHILHAVRLSAIPLLDDSLLPENQKESDLGNLFDILCSHFDGKINQGSTLHVGRVSRQSPVGKGGGCHLRKLKIVLK